MAITCVREATIADTSAIVRLIGEHAAASDEQSPVTEAYVAAYLSSPTNSILLAEIQNHAVGLLCYSLETAGWALAIGLSSGHTFIETALIRAAYNLLLCRPRRFWAFGRRGRSNRNICKVDRLLGRDNGDDRHECLGDCFAPTMSCKHHPLRTSPISLESYPFNSATTSRNDSPRIKVSSGCSNSDS